MLVCVLWMVPRADRLVWARRHRRGCRTGCVVVEIHHVSALTRRWRPYPPWPEHEIVDRDVGISGIEPSIVAQGRALALVRWPAARLTSTRAGRSPFLCEDIVRASPSSRRHADRASVNHVDGLNRLALAEVLVLAERNGLDMEHALGSLPRRSAAASRALEAGPRRWPLAATHHRPRRSAPYCPQGRRAASRHWRRWRPQRLPGTCRGPPGRGEWPVASPTTTTPPIIEGVRRRAGDRAGPADPRGPGLWPGPTYDGVDQLADVHPEAASASSASMSAVHGLMPRPTDGRSPPARRRRPGGSPGAIVDVVKLAAGDQVWERPREVGREHREGRDESADDGTHQVRVLVSQPSAGSHRAELIRLG